jgi:hypothetical protein
VNLQWTLITGSWSTIFNNSLLSSSTLESYGHCRSPMRSRPRLKMLVRMPHHNSMSEDAKEDEDGEGVGQERCHEGEGDHNDVVDVEVAEVAAQQPCSVREGVQLGERRPVDQLHPWLLVRERASRCL